MKYIQSFLLFILLFIFSCSEKVSSDPYKAADQFCEQMLSAARNQDYEKAEIISQKFIDVYDDEFYIFSMQLLSNLQMDRNKPIIQFMTDADLQKYPHIKEVMKRVIASKKADDEIKSRPRMNFFRGDVK